VAGPKERILSMRGRSGRLTWVAPPAAAPHDDTRTLLERAPFPGPTFRSTTAHTGETAWESRAHATMLDRVRAETTASVRPGPALDPARTATLRAHGYWETR
jgi:hypothetical protein